MDTPSVLVVGGGLLQCPMIAQAQALGLHVFCTDGDTQCPGAVQADEFIHLDTYDVQGHMRLLHQSRGHMSLCGVVTCGADVAPTVAGCAQTAGVKGIPLEVARRSHNKYCVRQALDDAGLTCYQPRWVYLDHGDPRWDEMTRYIESAPGYPCVIKPLEERASRGVTIVETRDGLAAGIAKALHYSDSYLIEQHLEGTEHSVEVILGNHSEVLWFNIVDRYFDYQSGTPIECGHVNPTRLEDDVQQDVLLMTLAAAKALDIPWGPFKIDLMMTVSGPKILECTARLSGGWDAQWSSPATGRHPMKLLLQLACGLRVDAQASMRDADGHGAVAAILPQQKGIFRKASLPLWCLSGESLGEMQGRRIVMCVQEGERIAPPHHNAQRAGYVMAQGQDDAQTWDTARHIANEIAARLTSSPA